MYFFNFRSVSPLNFSSTPHRLKSGNNSITPGQPPPPSSVHASARSRGIPVRSGSAANSSVSASSCAASRAGSTGDTSPRSCSSKESTPSPFHSPRNSIYCPSTAGTNISGGTASFTGVPPRISSVYDEDEAELNEEAYFESRRSLGNYKRCHVITPFM
jgi:hypothetical protein